MLLLFVVGGVFGVIKDYTFGRLSQTVGKEMRQEFYQNLLAKDFEFFENTKVGELTTKLGQDVGSLRTTSTVDMVQILKKFMNMVGSLLMMLAISKKLAFILLMYLIPKTVMIWLYGGYLKTYRKKFIKQIGKANSVATEAFLNIKLIKTFSTEEKENKKYCKKLEETYRLDDELARKNLVYSLAKTILENFSLIMIGYFGGHQVL
mmetsp:Transcript_13227/g.11311  ORF Transcript_13227/g.11311 Transcript_13227/m.11311 type:complete len:206 (-) Transcript_13227:666-1283(-)